MLFLLFLSFIKIEIIDMTIGQLIDKYRYYNWTVNWQI